MEIIKVKNQVEGGIKTFELLMAALADGAKTLGLATGSSPIEFYKNIVASDLDLTSFSSINLDEYVGLNASDSQSYHTFMNDHLFSSKPFKESFLPNGKAIDLDAEAKHYDSIIDKHPIHFQILGIGKNGHIGFNEPGTSFDMTTHVVDLTNSTIKANARFFDDEAQVPRKAISMGIASILKSKQIILMAWGMEKADAIKGMIEGDITEQLPASVLQKHDNVIVVVDEEAASKLV